MKSSPNYHQKPTSQNHLHMSQYYRQLALVVNGIKYFIVYHQVQFLITKLLLLLTFVVLRFNFSIFSRQFFLSQH